MPDQTEGVVPESREEGPVQAFENAFSSAMQSDMNQYKSATSALIELLTSLRDPNNLPTLQNKPKRKYDPGYSDENIVPSRNEDFSSNATEDEDGFEVEPVSFREIFKFDLAEGKKFKIYRKVFNPAYFPFNTLDAERIAGMKKDEVERTLEFKGRTNAPSGFDTNIQKFSVAEIVSLEYQGYIYTFTKTAIYQKDPTYSFKIEQFTNTDPNDISKEEVKRFGSLGHFGKEGFDLLKKITSNLVGSSQKQS